MSHQVVFFIYSYSPLRYGRFKHGIENSAPSLWKITGSEFHAEYRNNLEVEDIISDKLGVKVTCSGRTKESVKIHFPFVKYNFTWARSMFCKFFNHCRSAIAQFALGSQIGSSRLMKDPFELVCSSISMNDREPSEYTRIVMVYFTFPSLCFGPGKGTQSAADWITSLHFTWLFYVQPYSTYMKYFLLISISEIAL